VSIGLAMYQPPNDTLDAWIDRADQAMYTAKLDGRNRVHASASPRTATRTRQPLKIVD
jgi:diguanylate cyclase (GGDEF)-like protein